MYTFEDSCLHLVYKYNEILREHEAPKVILFDPPSEDVILLCA